MTLAIVLGGLFVLLVCSALLGGRRQPGSPQPLYHYRPESQPSTTNPETLEELTAAVHDHPSEFRSPA